MSEEELEKLASKRAEEETETVDDCDYDGCSRSCARDYYYFGFKDGFNKAIEKLKCCENCVHHRFCGDVLGCKLDFDKQFECDNNCHKYWELVK